MSAPLEIETHPFPALLPPQATVMMMGTFPPKEDKRAMEFHYPNFDVSNKMEAKNPRNPYPIRL